MLWNASVGRMGGAAVAVLVMGLAASAAVADDGYDPHALLLTWQQDPTTTMTIDWHIHEGEGAELDLVYRPLASDAENGEAYDHLSQALRELARRYRPLEPASWQVAEPEEHEYPFREDRAIHRVELTDLEPDETYAFRIGEDGEEFRFRTMPADASRAIHFAAGGDTRHSQDMMDRVNREAARYDLDFILWGGDLAYADGREDRLYRWEEWFDSVRSTLVREDGRVIPIISAIGNHEVVGGYHTSHDDYEQTDEWREEIAPYYYRFLAWPGQPGYGAIDFGEYMSVVLLDTNHSNPIAGEQTEWLEQALAEREEVPHVFPLYHVTGYPSHRSYDGGTEGAVREHFVPLFEQYGVRVAFEAHDHTYKRTHPIRDGEVDANGIVYLGDGAWGVGTREVHPERWYLAEAKSERHFILGTVHGPLVSFEVINEDGETIDRYPERPSRD